MSIWTKNIWDFKAVKVALVVGLIAVGVLYLVNYNSTESRCKRKYVVMTSYFSTKSSNRLQTQMYKLAVGNLVENCIKYKEVD